MVVTDFDYPCICGHVAGQHTMDKTNIFKFCLIEIVSGCDCACNDFTPDNLKYLENRLERRNA
jgi:hypothetical protein